MSQRKKPLNPKTQEALNKLKEQVVEDLRHNHRPMSEKFRELARQMVQWEEEARPDQ